MSKISIAGATTGTGTFTLASPATNVDRVLTLPDEAGTVLTTAGIPASAMPAGSVIQVVSVTKTDVASGTNTTFADVAGLSVSITPSSASNKILVIANVTGNGTALSNHLRLALVRNSTQIALGDADALRIRLSGWIYNSDGYGIGSSVTTHLDSPNTTSAVTYKVQASCENNTWYINRSSSDPNNYTAGRSVSSITIMEIAG